MESESHFLRTSQIRDVSGTVTLSGMIEGPGTLTSVEGNPVFADGTFAVPGKPLANFYSLSISSSNGQVATNTVSGPWLGSALPSYDGNGNLLTDGYRVFGYDPQSRPTSVHAAGKWRVEYEYDGLGRQRILREKTWTGASWSQTNETRYLYDGRLVVQERNGNNQVLTTYTRGPDLSGTFDGAGGIGGLLAMRHGGADTYYHADLGGNVTALVNTNQQVVGRYLYDPFGNTLGLSGPVAEINRYRFSSKEQNDLTGLYSFGYRFYDPNFQRWLNRDPLEEAGGINLNGYVGNDPMRRVDPDGLTWLLVDPEAYKQLIRDKFFGEPGTPKPIDPNSYLAQRGIDNDFNGQTGAEVLTDIGASVAGNSLQVAAGIGGPKILDNLLDWLKAKRASKAVCAAKMTTGAADDAAKWIWAQNKGVPKSMRQMDQRGWNPQQVTKAIKGGQQFPAQNLVNQGNPGIRYVHPQTGQSVVQDTVKKEIIHFGGPGFKY